ncbi:MAG: hypothetical protein HYU42_13235 [Candidatus Rokubacteria bacterium]|nr:hypothetical protein [Candidatus Rokubacteria bacterium]MBI3107157.1 hypothetical protein [Candidatus Rokubacteria bacterium]
MAVSIGILRSGALYAGVIHDPNAGSEVSASTGGAHHLQRRRFHRSGS